MTYENKPIADHTTDTLLELVSWYYDRQRYSAGCGIAQDPSDYAFIDAVYAELSRRI